MENSFHELIEIKKTGGKLNSDQIYAFAKAVAESTWPDYQIASLLMAIRLNGMDHSETADLTCAMAKFSENLNGFAKNAFVVDKHSTGGVGDGTSLVLAPVAAALGLTVPMMSGRSLALTGGTLDKLESVPGLTTYLPKSAINSQVKRIGLAMYGQNEGMAPVDRKLYSLRDAVGAVDSMPLIVASIVSKKLAEGLYGLVFDVKFGSGAHFDKSSDARALGRTLIKTARAAGIKADAILSRMDQPLGRAIGNAAEMRQAWDILCGRTQGYDDFLEVTYELLFRMLAMAGRAKSRKDSDAMARGVLADGSALNKLRLMMLAQGADPKAADNLPAYLAKPKHTGNVRAQSEGYVSFVDARAIALATLELGVLRRTASDAVDSAAGVTLGKKSGERVRRGELLAGYETSSASSQECRIAEQHIRRAFTISRRKPIKQSVIVKNGI